MADGSITIDTKIDDNGIKKGVNNIENGFDKLKSTITKTIAALGLGKLAKDFISTGVKYNAEIEKYQTALSTLLGSTNDANKVMQQIKKDAATTPFDVAGLTKANQLLISTGLSASDSRKTILALGNAVSATGGGNEELSRMAINLQQVKNIGKASALDIKQFAYAGIDVYSLLADYLGITKEEAAEMEVTWDNLNGALINASKEGGKYFGAMENQSRTLNGQWSTLKDNFNEFTGEAMKPLTDLLTTSLLPKANELIKILKEKIENTDWKEFGNTLKTILGIIIPLTSAFIAYKTAIAISNIITAVTTAMNGMTLAQYALNLAMSLNPIGLIVAAIAALVAAVIYLWNTNDDFKNAIIGIWDGIKNAFYTAINFIKKFLNGIIEFIKSNWKSLLLMLVNPFAGAFKLLYDNCEGFRNFVNNFLNGIKNFFVNTWNNIVLFFTEGIPNFVRSVIQWIQDLPYKIGYLIGSIIGHIIQFGIDAKNWVTQELPKIIIGIIEWFSQLPGKIYEWLCRVIDNIINWGKNILNISISWVSNTINSIIDWFKKLPGKVYEWLQNTLNKIKDFANNMASKGKQGAVDLFNNIVNTIKNLPSRMLEIGRNIVEGLWNGIRNAWGWIKQKVADFARGILDGMKSALGIHSPSKVFKEQVGKFIALGVGEGFSDNISKVYKDMKSAVDFETQRLSANLSTTANVNRNLNVSLNQSKSDIYMDGRKVAQTVTPYITQTVRLGGIS